jgi:hypothetical protein
LFFFFLSAPAASALGRIGGAMDRRTSPSEPLSPCDKSNRGLLRGAGAGASMRRGSCNNNSDKQ